MSTNATENPTLRIFQAGLNQMVKEARTKNETVANENKQIIVLAKAIIALLNHSKHTLVSNEAVVQVVNMNVHTGKQTPAAHIVPENGGFAVYEYSNAGEISRLEISEYLKNLLFLLLRTDNEGRYDAFKIIEATAQNEYNRAFFLRVAETFVSDFLDPYTQTRDFENDETVYELLSLPLLIEKLKQLPLSLEITLVSGKNVLFKIVTDHTQEQVWFESKNGDPVREMAVTQLLDKTANFGSKIDFSVKARVNED